MGRWFVVFVAAALLVPGSASAHGRSGSVAVDYRARVFPLRPALRGVIAARIYQSDRAVRLTVAPGHTVVVLGYLHEPFVRVTRGGVEVNASALTAGSAGLLTRLPPHTSGWRPLSEGRSVTWHDNRTRGLPPGVDHARWTIPLVIDGKSTRLEGELLRVHASAWWPWLVIGLPFVLISMLLIRRGSPVRLAAAAFGLVAAAGVIASAAGFAFGAYSSSGKWVELGGDLAFVLVCVLVITRRSPTAAGIAGGALGLLALFAATVSLPVLRHGVVLSAFPSAVARVLVVLTFWSAAAATVLGAIVYRDVAGNEQAASEG